MSYTHTHTCKHARTHANARECVTFIQIGPLVGSHHRTTSHITPRHALLKTHRFTHKFTTHSNPRRVVTDPGAIGCQLIPPHKHTHTRTPRTYHNGPCFRTYRNTPSSEHTIILCLHQNTPEYSLSSSEHTIKVPA